MGNQIRSGLETIFTFGMAARRKCVYLVMPWREEQCHALLLCDISNDCRGVVNSGTVSFFACTADCHAFHRINLNQFCTVGYRALSSRDLIAFIF